MTKASIYIAAISLALNTLVAQSSPPPPIQRPGPIAERQWQVKSNDKEAALTGADIPTGINANVPYEIHNTRRRELDLSSQLGPYAATLGFVGSKGGHFVFRRPNERDHRSVSAAETLALYHEERRLFRTATHWATTPAYEWQISHQQGANFALYNTKVQKYLVLIDGDKLNTTAGFEKTPKKKPTGIWGN